MKYRFLILIIVIASCKPNEPNQNENVAEFFRTGYKEIAIDSTVSHYNYSALLNKVGNNSYFSILNTNNFTVQIYDWETGIERMKIPLSKTGPDKIPFTKQEGHYLNGLNEILIYNIDTYTFFLVDSIGNLQKKYVIGKESDFGTNEKGVPQVSAYYPLIKVDETNFILQADALARKTKNYSSLNTVFELRLNDDSNVKPIVKYPEIYNEGNWGEYLVFCAYNSLNSKEYLLYTSFARDDSVNVFDLKKRKSTKKYAGSYHFNNYTISPLSKKSDKQHPDNEVQIKYEFTSPMYFGIHYDSINKKIYRIVRNFPTTQEKIIENGGDFRKNQGYAILVFDENFNKLGEFQLEKDRYNIESVFCINGKLYILLNARSQIQEDQLTFDEFDFSKLKNTE